MELVVSVRRSWETVPVNFRDPRGEIAQGPITGGGDDDDGCPECVDPCIAMARAMAVIFSPSPGCGPIPVDPDPITGGDSGPTSTTHDCAGKARVLQGNAATIGKPGGFSRDSVGNIPITSVGAAIIPEQWGGSKAALSPRAMPARASARPSLSRSALWPPP